MEKHDLTPKSKESIFESRKKHCKSAEIENFESETERDLLGVITPTDSAINSEIGGIGASTDERLSGPRRGVVTPAKRRLSFSEAAIKR